MRDDDAVDDWFDPIDDPIRIEEPTRADWYLVKSGSCSILSERHSIPLLGPNDTNRKYPEAVIAAASEAAHIQHKLDCYTRDLNWWSTPPLPCSDRRQLLKRKKILDGLIAEYVRCEDEDA